MPLKTNDFTYLNFVCCIQQQTPTLIDFLLQKSIFKLKTSFCYFVVTANYHFVVAKLSLLNFAKNDIDFLVIDKILVMQNSYQNGHK